MAPNGEGGPWAGPLPSGQMLLSGLTCGCPLQSFVTGA